MQGLRGASQDLKEHDAQELHGQRDGELPREHGLVVGEDALLVHGVGTSHGARKGSYGNESWVFKAQSRYVPPLALEPKRCHSSR